MSHVPFGYPLPDLDRAPADADRLLLWLARRQWRPLVAGVLMGVPWMLSSALVPAAIGGAVDHGLVARDMGALVRWSLLLLGLGLSSALFTALRHLFAVRNWLLASFRSGLVADDAVRRAGPALTRVMPEGEVVTIFAADFGRVGGVFDTTARFSGAVASFVVVALILLSGSTVLGLVMLIGGPVLVASLALVARPLQARQHAQRSEMGRLTALGTDTVAGLRILRGIGGEDVFLGRYRAQSGRVRAAGVRVAPVQASMDALQVLLPGLFVLLVTGLGAHLALGGQITPGQLVAYFGYTTFLTLPLRTAVELVDKGIRSRVAVRRIARVLAVEPDQVDAPQPVTEPGIVDGLLVDPDSGARIRLGTTIGVVSSSPDDAAALAARLARVGPGPSAARLDGIPLGSLPLAEVRRRVSLSEAVPALFTGTVREALTTTDRTADTDLLAAVHAASAEDVLDTLDGGLDGHVEERGRTLSGGQRQRLVLARALARDPEVLVLVEPTSAVDAHTEARVAQRLTAYRRARAADGRPRTTVLTSTSPLVLDACDEVLLLAEGRVVAHGRHEDLSHSHAAYRDVVLRGEAL